MNVRRNGFDILQFLRVFSEEAIVALIWIGEVGDEPAVGSSTCQSFFRYYCKIRAAKSSPVFITPLVPAPVCLFAACSRTLPACVIDKLILHCIVTVSKVASTHLG